jgi:putative transposase
LAGGDARDALAGKDGLLDALKKALAERALNAEMDHHLEGGEPDGRANSRNGYGRKTVLTETGRMELEVPRDRLSTFDPVLVAKDRRRLPGFDEKVVSLYARGLSVREIQGHLRELYGIDASADLVSAVTDAVLDEVTAWPERPLEPLYALVFCDALRVRVRDEDTVRNKAVHIALGVRPDGTKEVLGLWVEPTEGAKFGLRVMTERKNRGVEDVRIAVVDGLKGFPEAITAVFPDAQVQTCIVHTIRTQSAIRLGRRITPRRWAVQRNDMADLQTIFMNDDALDDELQDGLLIRKGRVVQPSTDPLTECRQVGQHLLRFGTLAA